jgi:hypothetical protein
VLAVALGVLAGAMKAAFGFVPAAVLAVPVLTTSTGASFATWAAIAGGIGAILYSVGLYDGNGQENFHIRTHPNALAIVPAGWTAAANPASDPVPPGAANSAITGCSWFNGSLSGTYASASDCVSQLLAVYNGQACPSQRSVTMSLGSCASGSCVVHRADCRSGADVGDIGASYSTGCPAGYSLSGGNCVLTTPSAVRFPADNRCGLKISGGVMSYDSRDPDCDNPMPGLLSADGKTFTVQTNNTQTRVRINSDGTVEVTQWSPSAQPGNTTINDVKSNSLTASANPGQITTSRNTTTNATGSDAFGQEPGAATQNAPSFPDDYAREQTLAAQLAQAQQTNVKLDQIKTQLTTDGITPSDPVARGQSDIEGVFFFGVFDSLKGWTMPGRSVICPTWSFSAFSHSYTIDAHCSLIEGQRALFSTIMVLVYGLTALFIVMRA